jgi:hypothetical protein
MSDVTALIIVPYAQHYDTGVLHLSIVCIPNAHIANGIKLKLRYS